MAILQRGSAGPEVEELQLRLAGFRGTIWDGQFGPGTELQVVTFQRDYMDESQPDGIVGAKTKAALLAFDREYSVDLSDFHCPCGTCEGFGQGRFRGRYRPSSAKTEAYHWYEYPGIHLAVIHTFKAVRFYLHQSQMPAPIVTSGYRCWIDNQQKGRQTTNHMGKGVDFDFLLAHGEDKAMGYATL